MLTFRVRWFFALVGFLVFSLLYVSIGIRWHIYRAKAGIYAQQETEHTFEAARLAMAARGHVYTDEARARVARYRKLAELHEKAALECARLRRVYEKCW